jgi:hypothetical protein
VKEQQVLRCGMPVYVEWDDSASYGGWRPDTRGMKVGRVRSIGYVFGVNKDGIILTTSLATIPTSLDVVALDPVVIPHGCIQNLQVLTVSAEPPVLEAKATEGLKLNGIVVEENTT